LNHLGTTGLNIVFDNCDIVSEVVIAVIGDELNATFTHQSIFVTLRILTDGEHHLTQLMVLMGQVTKDNMKDCGYVYPPVFLPDHE
jgi:hypothetical protein